jgi:pyridoxine 5'-phosphate synthase PdxJ
VLIELDKIRQAGQLTRQLGMRFNAGHALNYHNVQPVACLPGIQNFISVTQLSAAPFLWVCVKRYVK